MESRRSGRPAQRFVLDTSVLLADPRALERFDEHEVVVPLVVVEELDGQKHRMDEAGYAAREALRRVEALRASHGSLGSPVPLPGGGSLVVVGNHVDAPLPTYLDPSTPDHRILATSQVLDATLVTRDTALRLKGAGLGVAVEDYRADATTEQLRDGVREVSAAREVLDEVFRGGQARLEGAGVDLDGATGGGEDPLVANEGVVLRGERSQAALTRVVRVDDDGAPVVRRVRDDVRAFGLSPRDARQAIALDLLLDPEVACVSLVGSAGTGKTLLALAAGLELSVERGSHRRVAVYRPLFAVGGRSQEIGWLPGGVEEKLEPWMAAVADNLYALFRDDSDPKGQARAQESVRSLTDLGRLQMAAISHLRGRSITDEFVIVDEAQNAELSVLRTAVSRMAAGSKMVLGGDVSQIDNPYVGSDSGLATLVERFRGSPLFGHVTLAKGQRSPLADLAASRL